MGIPQIRLTSVNQAPIRSQGQFVLYWMTAFRRTSWNFALEYALEIARELGRPLVVLEALRCDYRWASDRLHQFVLEGMAANRTRFEASSVHYYPYVERSLGDGKGLLQALSSRACCVVTDEYPSFFLPSMVRAAGSRLEVRLEQVDSNGLLPLRLAESVYPTAHGFRRFLQRTLSAQLRAMPSADPLSNTELPRLLELPADVLQRWAPASAELLIAGPTVLDSLPIDHSVPTVELRGGTGEAQERLEGFVRYGLSRYLEDRNHPDEQVTSGLSPYLHFGHISAHEVASAVLQREGWTEERLGDVKDGSRTGWWGVSEAAEAFLDQLVTWRELGFNMSWQVPNCDAYETLPSWARQTLAEHAPDRREHLYSIEQLEQAETHDQVWNAAQRQLLREGYIHNYMRMLWGKKILEWSASPQQALDVMLELNNKYALDGRDPNSISGIMWVLGRYDRAWGPERRVFGKIRYMSSDSTVRKLRAEDYLARYGR